MPQTLLEREGLVDVVVCECSDTYDNVVCGRGRVTYTLLEHER